MWDLDSVITVTQNSASVNFVAPNGISQNLSKNYVLKLDEIRKKISQQSSIYPKFIISSSQEVNAGATWQNGQPITIFNLGLLNKVGDDYDAIAAVVSHEYSHLTLRHQQSQQATNAVVDVLASLAMIAIDSKYGGSNQNKYHGLYQTGLGLTATLAKRSYSRNEELEADAQGVKYMIAAGYSPEGAIRLQEKIIPSTSSFFSTHPSSDSRIRNIKEAMYNSPSNIKNKTDNKPIFAANTNSPQGNQSAFLDNNISDTYLKTCEDIGFNPNSNMYGDCVFKLSGKKLSLNNKNSKPSLIKGSKVSELYISTCNDIGFKPDTTEFESCITQIRNKSKSYISQQSTGEIVSNIFPVTGQIGSVISIKEKGSYIIFSASIQDSIPLGTAIKIANDTSYVNGKIAMYYDGYYSASVDNIDSIKQGARVLISN